MNDDDLLGMEEFGADLAHRIGALPGGYYSDLAMFGRRVVRRARRERERLERIEDTERAKRRAWTAG